MVLRREVRALEQLLDDHLRDLGHRGAEVEGDVHHHAQRGVPRRLMLGELHLAVRVRVRVRVRLGSGLGLGLGLGLG